MTDALLEKLKNVASVKIDADYLGQIVRNVWVRWAKEQPDCKPEWIAPWEDLPERIKDVDRRIGEEVELVVKLYIAAMLGSPIND